MMVILLYQKNDGHGRSTNIFLVSWRFHGGLMRFIVIISDPMISLFSYPNIYELTISMIITKDNL